MRRFGEQNWKIQNRMFSQVFRSCFPKKPSRKFSLVASYLELDDNAALRHQALNFFQTYLKNSNKSASRSIKFHLCFWYTIHSVKFVDNWSMCRHCIWYKSFSVFIRFRRWIDSSKSSQWTRRWMQRIEPSRRISLGSDAIAPFLEAKLHTKSRREVSHRRYLQKFNLKLSSILLKCQLSIPCIIGRNFELLTLLRSTSPMPTRMPKTLPSEKTTIASRWFLNVDPWLAVSSTPRQKATTILWEMTAVKRIMTFGVVSWMPIARYCR